MACGCGGNSGTSSSTGCSCVVQGTAAVSVTGAGSALAPYRTNLVLDPNIANAAAITAAGLMVTSTTGTPGSVTINGVTGTTFTGLATQNTLDLDVFNLALADNAKVDDSQLGVPSAGSVVGVATLGADGILTSSQRPSGTSGPPGSGESSPGVPINGAYFGARAFPEPFQFGGTGTTEQATVFLEGKINGGRKFRVHRHYVNGTQNFAPNAIKGALDADASAGRISIMSLKCPNGMTWLQLANDNGVGGRLQTAIAQLKKFTHKMIVMVGHHECDLPPNQNGSAADFSLLQTRFFAMVRAAQAASPATLTNVSTAVGFGGYPLYNNTMTQAQVKAYLPSDLTLVDIIGTDPYDMSTTVATQITSFAAWVTPWLNFTTGIAATGSPAPISKPLGIFEAGVRYKPPTGPSPTPRASWWSAAFNFIEANGSENIKIFCPWHDNDGTTNYTAADGGARDFWLDGGSAGAGDNEAAAVLFTFAARSQDSWFTGAGAPVNTSSGPGLDILQTKGDIPTFSAAYGPIAKAIGTADGMVPTVDHLADQGWNWTLPLAGGNPTLTTKGDLSAFSATFGPIRTPVSGTDGLVLTSDSTSDHGWNWKAAGGPGGSAYSDPIVVVAFDAPNKATWTTAATASGGSVCAATNAHIQINAALASANANNRSVLLSPGTFTINAQSVAGIYMGLILQSDVPLRGSGQNLTTILLQGNATGDTTAATSNHVVSNANPGVGGTQDQYLVISDMTIDGNAAGNAGGASNGLWHGLKFWHANQVIVERVTVRNCRGINASTGETFHFDAQGSANVVWRDCIATVTGGAPATSTGFASNYSTNLVWDRCFSEKMVNGHGFSHYLCRNLVFTDCLSQRGQNMAFNVEHCEQVAFTNCISGGRASIGAAGKPYTNDQSLYNGDVGFSVLGDAGDGNGGLATPQSNYVSFTNCHNRGGTKGFFVHGAYNTTTLNCSSTEGSDWAYTELGTAGAIQTKMLLTNRLIGFMTDGAIAQFPTISGVGGVYATHALQNEPAAIPATGVTYVNPYPFDMFVYIDKNVQITLSDTVSTKNIGVQSMFRLNRGMSLRWSGTVAFTPPAADPNLPTSWKWMDA